jgi:hypothetical protein
VVGVSDLESSARWHVGSTYVGDLIERVTSYPDVDQARAAAERLAEERS